MIKSFLKNNAFFIVAATVVAGALIALNALFPYSGDDWYWASRPFSFASITELNGRYFGTVIALIITKCYPLRIIICSAVTFALIYILSRQEDGNRFLFFMVAAALVLAAPVSIINETLAWASGFANYTPSALIVIAYISIVKGEFNDDAPEYGKAVPFIAAALGFLGAFFVETVTIGNVIVGAAVLIYHIIRFKKPSAALIAFLGGAIIGAALMFVNPVYFQIAGGDDPVYERSVSLSLKTIISAYFNTFQYYFAYDNFWLNLFIFAMLVVMFIRRFALVKKSLCAALIACFAVQIVFLAFSGLEFFGFSVFPSFDKIGVVKGAFTFLFCAASLAEGIVLVKNINIKLKFTFIAGCVLAYSLPLLAVNPVGGRNFSLTYFLFAMFALALFNENIKGVNGGAKFEKRVALSVFAVAAAGVVAFLSIYISKYAYIRSAYNERAESVYAQRESDTVTIKRLPSYETLPNGRRLTYVHNADPDNDYFLIYFKDYYGLPSETVIILK